MAALTSLTSVAFGVPAGAADAVPASDRPRPPVIHESFSPLLPCNRQTTIGAEGCEEHAIVAADERIDREVAVIFSLLHDSAARTRFVHAETTWFAYRVADCASQADIYEAGSEAAVVAASCALYGDTARSADLRRFYEGLAQGRPHVPPLP
ncbi:MAG TPA: lysozyme inhibitor LprI family protein [Acidimicrobiales bacterium]|nr:lysozyme inhibitor LprI family protein [Acidimicrobiales bacterium]